MAVSENIPQIFADNFENRKDKRIVLYGLGGNTKKILDRNGGGGFRIVALMDAEKAGSRYWGLPVITVEEAGSAADLVVVVARDSVARIIYNRICGLEQCGVPVFDVKGNRLKDLFSDSNAFEGHPYWDKNLTGLLHEIDRHEIISFDIYDTLLMRRVPRAVHIFELVEEELREKHGISLQFSCYRIQAGEEAERKNARPPDIFRIYDILQGLLGISSAQKELLLKTELETEINYACPRADMVDCFNYAVSRGKKVYLLSDMYFTAKQLREILGRHGISGYDSLLVSCEKGRTKSSGGLFYEISADERKKMLHIGDNHESDYINAKAAGCSAYEVWSSYEMLLHSNLGGMLVHVSSLADSLLAGNFMSTVLNSPFAMGDGKGRILLEDPQVFCRVCFLPYFLKLVQWLMQLSRTGKKEGSTLFLLSARDGFLVKRLLDSILTHGDAEKEFPDYKYFYTSRRASAVAAIYNEDDIEFVLRHIHMTADFGYILSSMFGVDADDSDIHRKEKISAVAEQKKLSGYLKPYYGKILAQARRERENYRKYIKTVFDPDKYDNIMLYDLACQGTVAHNVSRILGKDVKLVCFATFNIPNDYIGSLDAAVSMLGNYDDYSLPLKFLSYYKLFEVISASGEPPLVCFDGNGKPVFDRTVKYENAGRIAQMQDMLVKAENGWEAADPDWMGREYSAGLCDFMLSLVEEKHAVVADGIKSAFLYESKEDNCREHRIWEETVG